MYTIVLKLRGIGDSYPFRTVVHTDRLTEISTLLLQIANCLYPDAAWMLRQDANGRPLLMCNDAILTVE